MILEKQTENIVFEEGESQETFKTEIDIESLQFLKQMLSKFYSDAIGSLIREVTSNALDSHREAGVTDPIIVRFKQGSDGNYEFSVEDFGIGINKDTINNILRKYGKSTKRYTADQLGAFGLGWKSPIAYTPSFHFIGRKDGVETKAMMYESEEDIDIDILHEGPTTERNGVKVIVPVKYTDRNEFIRKIKEQLCYFENVYFECDGVNNNFTIVRHDLFQWSEMALDNNLHLCLDNVYYPLDFQKLGISTIQFKAGLRFSLTDGIFPVPNREQIKYTKEAKEKILARIKEVADHFVNKFNEKIVEECDYPSLVDFYSTSDRSVAGFMPGLSVSINPLLHHSNIVVKSPNLKGLKKLTSKEAYSLHDFLFTGIECTYEYTGRLKSMTNKWYRSITYRDVRNNPGSIYIYTGDFPVGNRRTYIKDEILSNLNGRIRFIKQVDKITLGSFKQKYISSSSKTYYQILKLWEHPKSEWRDRIKDFQYIKSLIFDKFKNLDKIDVTQAWLDSRKKQRVQKMAVKGALTRRIKLQGEITIKLSANLERYVHEKNCKFVSTVINLKDAHKAKYTIIYGKDENEQLYQKMFNMFDTKKVKFGILSEKEYKKVEKDVQLHNWINISKFMEGKHTLFRKAVTAYLIDKLIDNNQSVFDKLNTLREISSNLTDKLTALEEYRNSNYTGGDKDVFESMVKVAEDHKLFDLSIYGTYKEINTLLKKLPFINAMCYHMNRYNTTPQDDRLFNPTKDLFRYYGLKMNWQNYIPLNEEVVEELTDEKLEELEEEAI